MNLESGDYLKLTEDAVFKAYFKDNEHLLIQLLEDFLPLPKSSRIVKVKILNPEIGPDELEKVGGIGRKKFILDLRVDFKRSDAKADDKSEIAHVEIQTTPETHFADRLLAYSSRLYSEQLRSGETYKVLAPVYSLVFMTANLKEFESLEDEYYHVCNIRRTTKPDLILTRGMCFVIVELMKFKRQKVKDVHGQREAWSYLLKNSGKMDRVEYKRLQEKGEVMAEAVKRLWDISQNEGLRELLRVQERERMDRASREETVHMEGLKKGLKKGLEKGREEGVKETALKMLAKGLDFKDICEFTGLSKKEIENLKNAFKNS